MAFLTDGFATLISIAGAVLKEVSVTPPGIEGGGENDTTTMRNTVWRTKQPKKLKSLSPCSFSASYDPAAYSTLLAQINVNQQITLTFPDASTLTFWGWLDEFKPGDHTEGAQPVADCTIIPSNQDNSGNEVAPT